MPSEAEAIERPRVARPVASRATGVRVQVKKVIITAILPGDH